MHRRLQLGAAAQVNYDFHENLTAEKMDKVLEEYRRQGEGEKLSNFELSNLVIENPAAFDFNYAITKLPNYQIKMADSGFPSR